MENTKKGEGVYETLFFRAFVMGFKKIFLQCATCNKQQATCYMRRTTDHLQFPKNVYLKRGFMARHKIVYANA